MIQGEKESLMHVSGKKSEKQPALSGGSKVRGIWILV